jgi:hypothetical protein
MGKFFLTLFLIAVQSAGLFPQQGIIKPSRYQLLLQKSKEFFKSMRVKSCTKFKVKLNDDKVIDSVFAEKLYYDTTGRQSIIVHPESQEKSKEKDSIAFVYDDEGKLIEKINYKNNSPAETYKFLYDANDRIIQETGGGNDVYNYLYKYNKKGFLIQREGFAIYTGKNGTTKLLALLDKYVYKYNSRGYIVKESYFYQGSEVYRKDIKYNKNGKKTEETTTYPDKSKLKSKFYYNENDLLIEEAVSGKDGFEAIYRSYYEFYP